MKMVMIWALTAAQFDAGRDLARQFAGRGESISCTRCSLEHFDASPSQLDKVDGVVILAGHAKTDEIEAAYKKMGAKIVFLAEAVESEEASESEEEEGAEETEGEPEEAKPPKAPKAPKAPKPPKAPKKTKAE